MKQNIFISIISLKKTKQTITSYRKLIFCNLQNKLNLNILGACEDGQAKILCHGPIVINSDKSLRSVLHPTQQLQISRFGKLTLEKYEVVNYSIEYQHPTFDLSPLVYQIQVS